MQVYYRGWLIAYCEENGRRFWSARNLSEGAWAVPQEFCSLKDAEAYVDARATR